MALASPVWNEERWYIDPRLLDASGGGVDDPNYNTETARSASDSIDLEDDATVYSRDPQTNQLFSLNGKVEQDVGRHSHTTAPPASPRFALRPEAAPFVPKGQRQASLTLDTQIQGEHTSRQKSSVTPRTPRIQLSRPPESRLDANATMFVSKGPNSKTRSNHSSPDRRSASISRQQRPKRPVRPSSSVNRGNARLSPMMTPRAANWVMEDSYHIGDHLAHCHGPPMATQPSLPWPGHRSLPQTTPTTTSQRSRGYSCSHDDCHEQGKVWVTRSELIHHQRKHLSEEQRPHACEVCHKRFQFPKDVLRHMVVHGSAQNVCSVCRKSFGRFDNLVRHIKSQHPSISTPTSTSQVSAPSPSASSATSFVQSSHSDTGPSTPLTLSPLAVKSMLPSSQQELKSRGMIDNNNDPFFGSAPQTPSSQPMLGPLSNDTWE